MSELKDQLSLLGRKTEYKQDYAPEVLEAFDNKHPGNDYWVRFNCPEFTSLCPIALPFQFSQSWCFPRRLCEYYNERLDSTNGS